MRFEDRAAAGRELARRLAGRVGGPCIVGAIPRGGVAVALPVAGALAAPLVVVNAHKLSAPGLPEFAVGAMDEDGEVVVDTGSVRDLGLDAADLERACRELRARMTAHTAPAAERLAAWMPRALVLVDDGLATGLTMLAAVRHARRHGATGITVAVPCASRDAAEALRPEVDELVCPVVDAAFAAVGEYYRDFRQVSDAEVAALLARAARGTASA